MSRWLPCLVIPLIISLAAPAVAAGVPPRPSAGPGSGSGPGAHGVSFVDASFEEAQAQARASSSLLLVEVFATWCGPCKRQAAEVFEAPAGAALAKGMVAWRADFDAPEQRARMEQWNILSLPTVLVLRSDGSEIDRVEGYETKDAFVAEVEQLKRGRDPLPVLEERLRRASAPADRLHLAVEVGHKKLVRGDPEGLRLLERTLTEEEATVVTSDSGPTPAEEALFLLGRYHSRVKRDFGTARHLWRELLMRFPNGTYEGTAAWWYAGALHELHDDDLALDLLERRARQQPDENRLDALVSFAVEKKAGLARVGAVLNELAKAQRIEDALLKSLRARLAATPAT